MVLASFIGDSELVFIGDKFLIGVIGYNFKGDYFLLDGS